jgi:hypothetical protein
MDLVRADHGKVAVFFAILMPAFLIMTGLVVDGGGRVRALQRADNIAMEAARAAGQIIDAPQAIRGGVKEIGDDDEQVAAAANAAATYAREAGAVWGQLIVHQNDDGENVIVEVRLEVVYEPVVMGLFGMGTRRVPGRASATLIEQ